MRIFLRNLSTRASRHLTKDGKLVVLENQYITGKGLDPGDNEFSLQEEKDDVSEKKAKVDDLERNATKSEAEDRAKSNQGS